MEKPTEWINKIAFHQNIRSEIPNQELAKELADAENSDGIKEIAGYLYDKNKSISSDCIKVLYEIGYLMPELIADYVDTFIDLLSSKINRMVWGGMIALATVSKIKSSRIYQDIDLILMKIETGTVITEVWGLITITNLSIVNSEYKAHLFPVLCDYLEKCRPIDFAKRLETILPVVSDSDEEEIVFNIVEMKKGDLSEGQKKKLQTVINKYNRNKRAGKN